MAPTKKKVVLRAFAHKAPDWAKVRSTIQVGYTTARVGPRAVIISRPRHPKPGEFTDKTEVVLETVTVRFNEDGTSSVRINVSTFAEGAFPKFDGEVEF